MRRRLPIVFQQRDFSLLWVMAVMTAGATQMIAVAVGWQVYAIHRDPFDLGLIGLMEFVPLPLLALPAGQLADRLPRRLVVAVSITMEMAVPALLIVVSLSGAAALWPFLTLAFATGVGAALGTPASRALFPQVVPPELLARAMALRSIGFQAAVIGGPAVGGVLFAVRPELVYGVATGMFALGLACALALRVPRVTATALGADPAPGLSSLLAGISFIRRTPVILGAISLDLFAVLFGGAVALLPVFARSILHTGPEGLGLLRSAPAIGALLAGLIIARRPLRGNAGRTLLTVVAVFGVSMVVFGLSRWFVVSLVALAVGGFADMFSVNIRSTTVALATPESVRGRVLAVEMVFISASNELGAFESGAAAALLGATPAVVAGGALTIAVAAIWPRLFPPLARVDRMEDLRPEFAPD